MRRLGLLITETSDGAGTERIGARTAATLRGGDVVLLSGDLGAGKTTFVRGAAAALGVRVAVTSPTFAIANRYPVADPALGGPLAVSHLDLYRLEDLSAEDPDLLGDYIGPDAVAFVEWPGGAEATIAGFGAVRYRVALAHAGGDRRQIRINGLVDGR